MNYTFLMLIRCSIFLIPLLPVYQMAVQANDTTATIAAGGIEYKTSQEISMDEETLKISIESIEVAYKFFNHSDKEVREYIAFPLPPIAYSSTNDLSDVYPSWDEDYHARQFIEENPTNSKQEFFSNSNLSERLQSAAFINFKRTVNGERYGYHYRIQAKDRSGKDITNFLKTHQIPLSIPYLTGFMEDGELYRNKALQEKLKKLKLLDKQGFPLWSTQTIYFWTQIFEPHKETVVTHSYRPHAGYHWLDAKTPNFITDITIFTRDGSSKNWADYCVSTEREKVVLKEMSAQEHVVKRAVEVQYVLSTGANWQGPIRKINLEIIPPHPEAEVFFCWPGKITRHHTGRITSTIESFTPTKDLKILFIMPQE
jgi:hypothetical protein